MMDALGAPQSILVIGGTSEIALATLAALPRNRLEKVLVAARPSANRNKVVKDLELNLQTSVTALDFESTDFRSHKDLIENAFGAGDIDIVLVAVGLLGDNSEAISDPNKAVEMIEVNFTGAANISLYAANKLKRQGHGLLILLSSVAGDRPRSDNFIYAASKAGIDSFTQGLGDSLVDSGVRVLIVRPGMVRTRMTSGMDEAPMTCNPEDVAAAVLSGIANKSEIVYAPVPLKYVMSAMKALPRPVFRKVAQRIKQTKN